MKLLSCHIENFGKLHDFSYDFSDGVNMICEDNGWGKSTFAAFIRAMFYGFAGTTKKPRSGDEDRKRYKPWQGGAFGGDLTFEASGKKYSISRFFGDKAAGDTFELRNPDTNLIIDDYHDNIGEELFKIDKESFEKTVFIKQSSCETKTTDDINAKIGRLAYDSDDLNSYDRASGKLEGIMNSLDPNRKTGSISKRRNEISGYEMKVQSGKKIPESISEYEAYRSEKEREFGNIKTRLEEISAVRKKSAAQEWAASKKDEWERLKNTAAKRTEEKEELERRFPGGVPDLADVDEVISECRTRDAWNSRMGDYRLSEEEKNTLASLDDTFAAGVPSDEEIDEMLNEAKTFGRLREEADKAEKSLRERKTQKSKTSLFLIVFGIAVIAAGLAVAFVKLPAAGMIIAAGGAVLLVIGILSRGKKEPAESNLSVKSENSRQSLESFLGRYKTEPSEAGFAGDLYALKDKAHRYLRLGEKQDNFDKAEREYNAEKEKIDSFLNKYGFSASDGTYERLNEIRGFAVEYKHSVKALTEAKADLEQFETTNPVSELGAFEIDETLPSVESLDREKDDLAGKREEVFKEINWYNKRIEELQEQYEEWEEDCAALEELKAVQTEEQKKYDLVKLAKEKLYQAKEAMTARYAEPIRESFTEYYGMISGEEGKDFLIDANTNVTKKEQGIQRETNALSTGYRDLVGIALRIALVDAMYEDEKPPLIMDDPFTNLDDEKVKASMDFLEKLAEKHQIIYFTCSRGRRILFH